MFGLPKEQECPYCGYSVEDHLSNWSDEEEEITCDGCNKNYTVFAEYEFKGFNIKRLCQRCGDELDDDDKEVCEECNYSQTEEI